MTDASTKVALVTGGARNIGRSIALHLAAEGWRVAILDVLPEGGEVARTTGGLFLQADVGREDDVERAIARTLAEFGHLDGLVCNAAIVGPDMGPLHDVPFDAWRRQLAVNLDGPFLCAKHACRALAERRGTIVNLSSTRARMSEPNTFAYSASKGAVEALTHALAISLGPAVRVNAVAPGWIHGGDPAELRDIDHAQHPVGRVGTPEDIAAAVAFLLGERSGFITGATLVVDGGMTRKMIYRD